MSCTIGRSRTFGLKRDGIGFRFVHERVRGDLRLADDELIPLAPNRSPRAVQVKQREAVWLRHDLRLMAALGQLLARLGRERGGASRCASSRRNTGAASCFAAGSADSNTTSPYGPSSDSIHRRERRAPYPLPG